MAAANQDPIFFRYPNYEKEVKLCSEFLNNYEDLLAVPDLIYGKKKYLTQLVESANLSKRSIMAREC
jgi:IS1 family transposase